MKPNRETTKFLGPTEFILKNSLESLYCLQHQKSIKKSIKSFKKCLRWVDRYSIELDEDDAITTSKKAFLYNLDLNWDIGSLIDDIKEDALKQIKESLS